MCTITCIVRLYIYCCWSASPPCSSIIKYSVYKTASTHYLLKDCWGVLLVFNGIETAMSTKHHFIGADEQLARWWRNSWKIGSPCSISLDREWSLLAAEKVNLLRVIRFAERHLLLPSRSRRATWPSVKGSADITRPFCSYRNTIHSLMNCTLYTYNIQFNIQLYKQL